MSYGHPRSDAGSCDNNVWTTFVYFVGILLERNGGRTSNVNMSIEDCDNLSLLTIHVLQVGP